MKNLTRSALLAAVILSSAAGAFAGDADASRNAPVVRAPEKPKKVETANFNGQQVVTANFYGQIDQAPIPVNEVMAEYPAALEKAGIKGKAIVTFTLTYNGQAKDLSVVATQREFAGAAINAAVKNKYKPAKGDGVTADCKVELIYDFPGPRVEN